MLCLWNYDTILCLFRRLSYLNVPTLTTNVYRNPHTVGCLPSEGQVSVSFTKRIRIELIIKAPTICQEQHYFIRDWEY
jgi:hypothetical protein